MRDIFINVIITPFINKMNLARHSVYSRQFLPSQARMKEKHGVISQTGWKTVY